MWNNLSLVFAIQRIPSCSTSISHASEEDVVTDYLRSLCEHTVKVLELKIGRAFKGMMTLDFVIMVPAMWPEKAKAVAFSCAERAGFGKAFKLRIISEPETATMHALHASSPHGLEVGDKIVLCDAGGGTVDLTTFSIPQLTPILCKERGTQEWNSLWKHFPQQEFRRIPKKSIVLLPWLGPRYAGRSASPFRSRC